MKKTAFPAISMKELELLRELKMSEMIYTEQPLATNAEIERPENMRPKAASRYTGVSESTLAKLRMLHRRAEGPRFIKLSGCVVYRRADLDRWMEQNVV